MAGHKKDQGFVAEMVTYFFFWLLCKFMSDGQFEYLFRYDVATEVGKVVGMEGEEYERAYLKSVKGWFL